MIRTKLVSDSLLPCAIGQVGPENDPMVNLVTAPEHVAFNSEYFVKRKPYANVDHYSWHHKESAWHYC